MIALADVGCRKRRESMSGRLEWQNTVAIHNVSKSPFEQRPSDLESASARTNEQAPVEIAK